MTRFHLRSAADILSVLLLDRNPEGDLNLLLTSLEAGLPSAALGLLQIPITLNRGEYLTLFRARIINVGQLWSLAPTQLKELLGERRAKQLEAFRPKQQAGHTAA